MVGRGKSKVTKLREDVLSRRGMLKKGYGKLAVTDSDVAIPRPLLEPGEDREGKTILMLALERVWNTDIDSLLDPLRSIREVGEKLGIDESTVSKWRLMRGLRSKQATYVLE